MDKFQLRAALLTILISAVLGCAPDMATLVEAPDLPAVKAPRSGLTGVVTIQAVSDSRPEIPAERTDYTHPAGEISSQVEKGLRRALMESGVVVEDNAPLSMRAEVRNWRAQVSAREVAYIESEASIYLELTDLQGRRVYSGTFSGNRSSQFPIVVSTDVQDSLALAMANAIEQAVNDAPLRKVISGNDRRP